MTALLYVFEESLYSKKQQKIHENKLKKTNKTKYYIKKIDDNCNETTTDEYMCNSVLVMGLIYILYYMKR